MMPAVTLDKVKVAYKIKGSYDRNLVLKLALLSFPLFLSVDLDNISRVLDYFINGWKVISFVVLLAAYVVFSKDNAIRKHMVAFVVLLGILFVSTIVNSGSLKQFFIVWGGFFGVILLVERYMRTSPRELLLATKIVLGFLVVSNAITVLLFPDGVWRVVHDSGWRVTYEGYWLLGHRNNFGTPILAALLAAYLADNLKGVKVGKSTILIAFASLVSVVLTWSATSVVTTVVAILVLVLSYVAPRVGIPKPAFLVSGYVIADVGVVFFDIQSRFSGFIENVLHRSSDLTGRKQLWDIVRQKFWDNPVIGHGVQASKENGLTVINANYVHAHNGELDVLYTAGFAGFACYCYLIVLSMIECAKYWKNNCVRISFAFLILLMIHAITGLFFSSYACFALMLCLNSSILNRMTSYTEGEQEIVFDEG